MKLITFGPHNKFYPPPLQATLTHSHMLSFLVSSKSQQDFQIKNSLYSKSHLHSSALTTIYKVISFSFLNHGNKNWDNHSENNLTVYDSKYILTLKINQLMLFTQEIWFVHNSKGQDIGIQSSLAWITSARDFPSSLHTRGGERSPLHSRMAMFISPLERGMWARRNKVCLQHCWEIPQNTPDFSCSALNNNFLKLGIQRKGFFKK